MFSRYLVVVSVLAVLLAPRPAVADTITVWDGSDPHCVQFGRKTLIQAPDDTVVIAGPIAPMPETDTVKIVAKAIAIDGSTGGSLRATGKGQSIFLQAPSVLVTGELHSENTNGKIILLGADTVQVLAPAVLDSGGDVRVICTGAACTLNVVGARIHTNHLLLDAQGDVIWDANRVDTFGPRDLIDLEAHVGNVRKTGAITVALSRGRLAAEVELNKVDAVSEAVVFCEACQPTSTPTAPLATASLPIGTPTPPPATPTSHDPTPTHTPAVGTPQPTPTAPPCTNCNTINGQVESELIIRAAGDVDISGDHYFIAENMTITGGGNINLTNTELRNDFGKCGEIVVTAGGQVNIQGATLVDDDCRNKPDVSELNGREIVPHSGFNDVVGFPTVDD